MVTRRLFAAIALLVLACPAAPQAARIPASPAHDRGPLLLVAARPDGYALLGFQVGMTPDEVIAVAKAAGWKYGVRQASLPSRESYVDQVRIEGPFFVTVNFSAVTLDAMQVTARSKTIDAAKETDDLYMAAVAKWGQPTSRYAESLAGPFDWQDKYGIHPTYVKAQFSQQTPGYIYLTDEAALAASTKFLAGPAAPKPSL